MFRICSKPTLLLLGAFYVGYFLCKITSDKTTDLQDGLTKNGSDTWTPGNVASSAYNWPPCQPNLKTNVGPLPETIQAFLRYRHCRHFPMLLDTPGKCTGADGSADVFLLLVIKSSPENFVQREILRKSWAQERIYNGALIRRVFISGTTKGGFEKGRLNDLVKLEQREHNDILQWDFAETLFNLTLKQILFLEWMEKSCRRVRFLMNGDDDVFVNTDGLVDYLQSLRDNTGTQHLFTGHLIKGAKPIRTKNSKYFVPFQVYNSMLYPPYCGGGGIIMSAHTARVIYKMSHSVEFLPIDDVYFGMCLAKAGLAPAHHMAVKTLGWLIPSRKLDVYNACFFKEHLVLHRLVPADIYLMWEKIHAPNLKCGRQGTISRWHSMRKV